jgi:hypothetical protein
MTAPTMQAPSAPRAAGNGNGKAPVLLRPFRIGAQPIDDKPYDVTVTTTASTQSLTPQYEIPSTGFLNEVELLVQGVTAANDNDVTFAADGPFNVIDNITFTDTNNAEIITPITGWDLYIINKFGGYYFSDDPKESPVYSATTGTGATGGSFAFMLRIPVELVPRDALGSLPNKSASTPFKVKITVSATATIYGTAPDAAPSVRFRMVPLSYWEPTATDGSGNPVAPNPPGVNTTQYWNKTDYTVNAGSTSPQLTSSTGFPIRNLIFILRDGSLSRTQGETDFPDPFKLQLQSNIITDVIKLAWQDRIARWYGYTGAVGNTAGNKDSGVYVLPYCRDFYPKPGWENRRGYLRTTDGMRLNVLGTIGGSGAHTLTVLTNYVGVASGTTLAQLTT